MIRENWPARFGCNGPEGTFWTDDAALANKLIAAAFDRDEWTVTDMQNPVKEESPKPSRPRITWNEAATLATEAGYMPGSPAWWSAIRTAMQVR